MTLFRTVVKARVILYDQGRILLLKQTKPNGGNYTLVGGTVEQEEFAVEALIRESKEEAGIMGERIRITRSGVRQQGVPEDHAITGHENTTTRRKRH